MLSFPNFNLTSSTPTPTPAFSLNLPPTPHVQGTYSFNANTPSFLPNFSVPSRNLMDINNFSSKFKIPIHTEPIRISSDSASKSYNGVLHTFRLPNVGDYSHDFQLQSLFLIKGIKDGQVQVDSLNNYLDSLTLNLNTNINIISKVDQIQRIESKNPNDFNSDPRCVLKLDFLNLPILTKYTTESNFQIAIKFKQPPPVEYELVYNVMFSDDKNYAQNLNKEEFTIQYQSQQSNNQKKMVEMTFKTGHITCK